MIISVSRRCDIPRFRFDWFMERLDAGFVDVQNPFNAAQVRRLSLLPAGADALDARENAEALVFWTRDPGNILAHAEALESRGFPFYVMTSVTGYPAALEPNVPQAETVIQTMGMLAQKTGPERVIWRYDPLFLSDQTDGEFHRRNFTALAARLQGTVRRVIVSVYDEYPAAERRLLTMEKRGVLKRLAHYGPSAGEKGGSQKPLLPEVRELLAFFARAAAEAGMEIQSCAEEDLAGTGIRPGACIDGELINKIRGKTGDTGRDKNQRPCCLCTRSVDIGTYGPCPAGCVYCYGLRP
jgi:hypothetical protein